MPYTVKVTTAPSAEPVTAADAQAHLDVTGDTALLEGMITAARQAAENYTRRAFITQTLTLVMDQWPPRKPMGAPWWLDTAFSFASAVELPRPPLQTVNSVKVFDYENQEETVSASVYFVNARSEPGSIVPRQLETWPTEVLPEAGVEIEFVAGYGDAASDVPQAIRQAILLEVATHYGRRNPLVAAETIDNASVTYVNEMTRNMVSAGLNPEAVRLLRPYRIFSL